MNALNHSNIGINYDLNKNNNNNNNNNMFRATKVWNEVLHSFYIGITLKKRRKHMRCHYNCFVANEALDWLTIYLQSSPHFSGQHISRFQSLNLLRKYLKLNIIEKVDSRKANYEFQDNKDLYRFTRHANENLPFISMTNSVSQQLDSTPKSSKADKQKAVVIPELSLSEKSEVYKQVFFQRCVSLIPKIDDLVNRNQIIPLILMHNLTRISVNGVVQLTDKSEDLPHWVMSAMKCLANWPKASGSGSCLPKYPGFENDVFAVIRDYFVNIGIPLIPNQLYFLIIAIYDMFAVETNNANKLNFQVNANQKVSPILSVIDQIRSQAINNSNDLMTSTPILENGVAVNSQLPPNHIFETIFMGDSPVTKIVSIDELTNLFRTGVRPQSSQSFSNRRTRLEHKTASNDKLNYQPISEKTRYFDAVTTMPRIRKNQYKSPISSNIYKTPFESPESLNSNNSSEIGYYNFGFAMQSPAEDGHYMLDKSISSLSSIYMSAKSNNDPKDNLSSQFTKSSNGSIENSNSNKSILNKTVKINGQLLEALQLSLLLMPPSNRRHLHLLLRLLSKLIQNKEIDLYIYEQNSLKDYVLKTFSRSILCADKENNYNELKAQQIVCILLDYCKDIFKVPQDLVKQIDCQLVERAKQKLFEEKSEKIYANYYCQQITTDEFELQRDVMSECALSDLLRSIMTDDKMTDREKLKWIKQFKSHHPEVYELYFTNQCRTSDQLKDKEKTSSKTSLRRQNSNLLKRFLSLRL